MAGPGSAGLERPHGGVVQRRLGQTQPAAARHQRVDVAQPVAQLVGERVGQPAEHRLLLVDEGGVAPAFKVTLAATTLAFVLAVGAKRLLSRTTHAN